MHHIPDDRKMVFDVPHELLMSRLLSTRWMGTSTTAHAGLITFFGGGAGVEPYAIGRPSLFIDSPSS